jgi:hypothetical protein
MRSSLIKHFFTENQHYVTSDGFVSFFGSYPLDHCVGLQADQQQSSSQMGELTQYLGDKYGIAVIPEPATMVLYKLGVCLLRRKK